MNEAQTESSPVDDVLRERFEAAWRKDNPEPIEACLPPADDPRYLPTLEELIYIELDFRWRRAGKTAERADVASHAQAAQAPAPVEDYLRRFPPLNGPDILLRLLREECVARTLWGDRPAIDEYRRRFPELTIPEWNVEASMVATGIGDTQASSRRTAAAEPPGDPPETEYPIHLGNYELLEELGRGGMGVVYRARQCSADRMVALKVIRRDLLRSLASDTHTGALERFQHEVQATARLEHENIVRVYEPGDFDGEPFFSMQYVNGPSLGEILRDGPLENRRAARYIEQVARAVAAAHRAGILHRDLKPQNILVDQENDRPLVADFGLAKLQESGDELTHSGDIMGSPPYMSPEQATDSSRVTGQSDVYSLGATLYHLLTGRPPFHAPRRVETLQQIMNVEPVPPRRLNILIERDLETICLKCLEKPLARRYDSADALADELRRYLDHKPIRARPVGPWGRSWRWCQRNPGTATSLALAVTFLVAALVAATVGYVQTSASLKVATQAKQESDRSFRHARTAVDRFFTHVSENELLDLPGLQPLRQELLEEAITYYEQFLKQRGDDPLIRDELAATHFRLGRIRELIGEPELALQEYLLARTRQRELLAKRPDDPSRLDALGDTANGIGRVSTELKDREAALAAYQQAREVRERLTNRAPDVAEYRRKLANTYMNMGMTERETDLNRARQRFERAQAIRAELVEQNRASPKVRCDQAMGHFNFAYLEVRAEQAATTDDGGEVADQHLDAAERHLEAATRIFEELLAENARGLANRYRLASCYRVRADLKSRRLNPDALDLPQMKAVFNMYDMSREQMVHLVHANPDVAEYRAAWAGLHMNVGLLRSDLSQAAAALAALTEARDWLEGLVLEFPNTPRHREDLVITLRETARLLAVSDPAASLEILEAAGCHIEKLLESYPDNDLYREDLDETKKDLDALRDGGTPSDDGEAPSDDDGRG